MSILNLQNVTLTFAEANKSVLQNINYEMNQGDFVILLGSNGSGKSTLLKLIHRQYRPTLGQIHFLGNPLTGFSDKAFSQKVAVLTQNCSDSLFSALTIYENYLLIRQRCGRSGHPANRKFLADYLIDFNPNLGNKLDMIVDQLSGGEKQALALALCLLDPPSLLLLDEHTSALDPKTSDQIMQLTQKKIDEHNITCVLTTHDLDIALHYGNRILMLRDGEVSHSIEKKEKLNLSKELLIKMYY